jgi:methyltransferase (TIGR00027 family)
MREGRPSTTASLVAAWRSISRHAGHRLGGDPIAARLVPEPLGALLRAADRAPRVARGVQAVADLLTRGQSRHLPFRTRAIDDAIGEATAKGVRQLVVLGAGLDARAWRLPSLHDAVVFEVDHPSTQAYKRTRVTGLRPLAREVRFVADDFEHGTLAARLEASGHDATKPSVFVWEGVTMYLTRPAIDATLATVRGRAGVGDGSRLVATYFDRGAIGVVKRGVMGLVSVMGEPIRSTFAPHEVARVLDDHALSVVEDVGDPEWSARYLGEPQRTSIERLVVAERR